MLTRTPLVALITLPALLAGCFRLTEDECSEKVCTNAVLSVEYPASGTAGLEGGRVRVCRNEVCDEATIVAEPAGLVGLGMDRPSKPHLFQSGSLGPRFVDVRVGSDDSALNDGDVYSIEVRDNAGAVVISKSWQATYEQTRPFGPECGDIVCPLARLQ